MFKNNKWDYQFEHMLAFNTFIIYGKKKTNYNFTAFLIARDNTHLMNEAQILSGGSSCILEALRCTTIIILLIAISPKFN